MSIDKSLSRSVDPESTASFVSSLTSNWLTPLIELGSQRPIEFSDLYELKESMKAEYISTEFDKEWKKELDTNPENPVLWKALARAFGYSFYIAGICKVFLDGMTVFTPIIMGWLITFVTNSNGPDPPALYTGYLLVMGIFIAAVLSAFLQNSYFRFTMNTGVTLRSALILAIYKKSLKLSPVSRQTMSTGKIVNMMSTDASRVDLLMGFLHLLWAAVVQFIIMLALLINLMGPSALAGLATMIVLSPMQAIFMKMAQQMRLDIVKWTDARIKLMNEILQGMKLLKIYSWEDSFMEKLFDIRNNEIDYVRKSQYLKAFSTTLMLISPTFMSVASFIVLGATTGELSPQVVFSSLVYFNLIRFPLMFIPMTLTMLMDARVALSRIGGFLLAPELQSTPNAKVIDDENVVVSINHGSFRWETSSSTIKDLAEDAPKDAKDSKETNDSNPTAPSNYKAISTSAASSPVSTDDVAVTVDNVVVDSDINNLDNISFNVKKGSLVAVVGAVGSGKSSLLSALLGEMTKNSGDVFINGSICYCAQQAWIQNTTLKDNILFGKPYDEDKYSRVLKICALEKDLEVLPDGDMTEIGEKGINLSGGQKQRVNIARAVYFDGDIILLDDPLSAVDSHVSKYLFNELIVGALKSKTRIFVTHQLQYLSQTDYILFMKDGAIVEQGTFDELMSKDDGFSKMMKEFGGQQNSGDSTEPVEMPEAEELVTKSANEDPIEDNKLSSNVKSSQKSETTTKLITQEDRQTGSLSNDVYWYYLDSFGSYLLPIIVILALVVGAGVKAFNDYWLALWTDDSFNRSNVFYMTVYAILGAGQVVCNLIAFLVLAKVSVVAAKNLHQNAISTIMRAPMAFFDTTPVGRVLNRFSRDQDVIDNALADSFRMNLNLVISLVFLVGVIAVVTPYFLIPMVPILLAYYKYQDMYRNASREIKRLDSISRSPLFSHFSETLNGLSSIRAYGEQRRFILLNQKKMDKNNEAYYIQIQSQRWIAIRLELLGALIVLSAALIAPVFRDTVGSGLVGLAISYALQITALFNFLIRQSVELENNMNSVERSKYYTNSSNVPQEKWLDDEASLSVSPSWPESGIIRVKNLSAKYRPGLPIVLDGINLEIQGGERIAVVGRTGSGKSSLMSVLYRLIEPESGNIEIDGLDICKISLKNLRSRLAMIPQDPVIYSGTLRFNLDPFNRHSDEDLLRVLDRSYLLNFVESLPDRLETVVAENGENFSVGQRCQICLARALLRHSRILIMDEATASIDLETDSLIQKTIREDFVGCTILTIAHRLNTIIDFDRVLVLSDGRVAEFDTPYNLLQKPDSLFSSMVDETGHQNSLLLRNLSREVVLSRK